MASIHEQLVDATVSIITNLGMSNIGAQQVLKQFLPETSTALLPAIMVTLQGCMEELDPYDTENDKRILPVAVHILDRRSARDHQGMGKWLQWQEDITNAFLRQKEVIRVNWNIDVRPMTVLEAQRSAGPAYQHCMRSFYLRFWCDTKRRGN